MCLSPCHRPSLCTSRGTYIIDEVSDIGRAGGQHAWGLGAHSAERGISAQWWPSQGGTQACQLCWVAKLVDVVGVLGTKQAEFSPDQSQGGVSFSGTLCGEHLGGEDLDRSGGGWGCWVGAHSLGFSGTLPTAQHFQPTTSPTPSPHLVLLSAPLLVVVEDVVPEVILKPLQISLVPGLLPGPCDEGHWQGEH